MENEIEEMSERAVLTSSRILTDPSVADDDDDDNDGT